MFPIGDTNRPGRIYPWVNYLLIAANIVVFLVTIGQANPEAFLYRWGAIPAQITAGEAWHTLVTSMFLHGGWGHLFGNMLFLFIFGDNVEDAFDHGLYLLFYLVTGVVASLAQVMLNPSSNIVTIGASGAISAVLGAYITMFGGNRIWVLVGWIPLPVPAWAMIGLWILLQILYGFGGFAMAPESGEAMVGYGAHVGGFFAGVLATLLLRGLPRPRAVMREIALRAGRPTSPLTRR